MQGLADDIGRRKDRTTGMDVVPVVFAVSILVAAHVDNLESRRISELSCITHELLLGDNAIKDFDS
jgi:hypothetical protein